MPQINPITEILKIPELEVLTFRKKENMLILDVESKAGGNHCPSCGKWCTKVHQTRPQPVRHLTIAGDPVILILHKHRYKCTCGQRPWNKTIPGIRRYQRKTDGFIKQIKDEIQQLSFRSVTRKNAVSHTAIQRIANDAARDIECSLGWYHGLTYIS
ncbi:MAG: transposase family protein [Halanaerobiales bacterium]|nr:transposase family protein [Halanaerobiales bacterium]